MNKDKIYDVLSGFYNPKYNKDKLNLLIETNDYFTVNLWNGCFDNYKISDKFNLFYSTGRFELYKLVRIADAYFTFGVNPLFDLSNLKLLYIAGSDDYSISNKNLKVFSSKGISSQAVAEYCLSMSLNLLNGFSGILRNSTGHIWRQPDFGKFKDKSLKGKTIGIAGLGNNGIAVSSIFRMNGCRVIGADLDRSKSQYVDKFYDDIDSLLPESDILIISVSTGHNSSELLGFSGMQKMKKESLLINISRGSVLNEDDLFVALKKGILAGAALDVVKKEPLSPRSKLWNCDNLIITPHIAGNINMFMTEITSDFIVKIKDNFGV